MTKSSTSVKLQNTSSISNKDQLCKDTKNHIVCKLFLQLTLKAQKENTFLQIKALVWNEGFPGNFLRIKPNVRTLSCMQCKDYTHSY